MTQPVYLIDASIYIFRAYFSMPDQWHSPEGYSVNAVCGYVQFLLQFLQRTEPKRVAGAFDESLGSCFRNTIYSGYKASRVLPDEALAFQLSACKQFTDIIGINVLASDRYEADDLIATLARLCREQNNAVCIVTRDKDLGQLLIDDKDIWWDFAADNTVNKESFSERFGVQAHQIVDYLALLGDSVDDIPGVPGIGVKTAAALLKQFDSVDNIYQDLNTVLNSSIRGAKSIVQKLQHFREQVEMARQLVRLESEVPLAVTYHDLQWRPPKKDVVEKFLEKYGLSQRFERQLARCYWWQ